MPDYSKSRLSPRSLQRRLDSYSLLHITPEQVASSIKIEGLIRKMRGGKSTALIYLRASEDPIARSFIAVYDNLLLPEWVRTSAPIEAFCISAGISPSTLWDVIVSSSRRLNQQLASLETSARHPEIVEKMNEMAIEGCPAAIKNSLLHMGFLPQSKTATVAVNVNSTQTTNNQVAMILPAPPAESTIRQLSDRFNATRNTILPPAQEPLQISGTYSPSPMPDILNIPSRTPEFATLTPSKPTYSSLSAEDDEDV